MNYGKLFDYSNNLTPCSLHSEVQQDEREANSNDLSNSTKLDENRQGNVLGVWLQENQSFIRDIGGPVSRRAVVVLQNWFVFD